MASNLTLEFMVSSKPARFPGSVAASWPAQIIIPSPPCFEAGSGVCAVMSHWVFAKPATVHYSQTSPLWFRLSWGNWSRIMCFFCLFFRCNFANIMEERTYLLQSMHNLYLFSVFSNCTVLNILTEICSIWDEALSLFLCAGWTRKWP